ncbi:putative membrane protein [Francisella tularensis subsp. novicida U112]|nr:putative membrane protein [Francisella tularensis subsp. novicida U112]
MSMLEALFIVLTPFILIYIAPYLIVCYLDVRIFNNKIIDRIYKILKWYYYIVFILTIIAALIVSPDI